MGRPNPFFEASADEDGSDSRPLLEEGGRTEMSPRAVAQQAQQKTRKKFRPEIAGLRGLDAMCIAGGHVFTGAATGGVGMFYCLSGVLVIASMHRDAMKAEPAPAQFLLRSLARILPEALTIIVVTLLLTWLFMPVLLEDTLADSSAAAAFYLNWRFVATSTDYEARDQGSSPLLLYWSIAVIVQLYAGFTLFYSALFYLGKKLLNLSTKVIDIVGVSFTAVALILSFWYKLQIGIAGGDYFATTAWVWMFCLGALIGRALPGITISRTASFIVSALALLLVSTLAFRILVSRYVPPLLRNIPVCMVILVSLAGTAEGDVSNFALDVFRAKPLQQLGKLSYWIFLLHWPMVMVYKNIFNIDGLLPYPVGIGVLGVTIVIGEYSARLFAAIRARTLEHPKRRMISRVVLFSLALLAPFAFHLVLKAVLSRDNEACAGQDLYNGVENDAGQTI